MSVIPGDVDETSGPPTVIPLAHFVVALGYLLAGLVVAGAVAGRTGHLAFVHLFVAGWICLTIFGAMTQFVPVWSGRALYSKRLAVVQLPLAAVGFASLAACFLTGRYRLLPVAGGLALVGVWTFCYNLARTLWRARPLDATETHFAAAVCWFVVVTLLGVLLALDFAVGLLPRGGLTHATVLAAHASAAVFGAVLSTVLGALYQLGTMFTQTDLSARERRFQRIETVAYPVGVSLLVGGRLLEQSVLASIGGVLVALSILGVAAVLASKLVSTRVEWTPMLTRYAVAALVLGLWAPAAVSAWLSSPLATRTTFGAPGTGLLLLAGGIALVVFGTLYHVVPFLIWVDRYSDLVGLEPVPTVEDLYDDRLAHFDGIAYGSGLACLVGSQVAPEALPAAVTSAGWALLALGGALASANLLWVLLEYGDRSVGLRSGA